MTEALGMDKLVAFKKQGSGKGSPESGSGGQLLRRQTATFKMTKDTFATDEITSHKQSTGVTYGVGKCDGTVSALLSPGTYAPFIGSILRADFAAVTAITGLSLTIAAGVGSAWTITRGTGDFLAGGIKVGMVVQITAGTYTAGTKNKDLLVIAVTATVLTVIVINATSLTAEGPIATSTVTVPGKISKAPLTGHTNDYYSIEEFYPDAVRSVLYQDMQIGKADIGLPSTGNATLSLSFMGLDRTKSGSQVLTSPTAETTTPVLNATNGYILIDGSLVAIATALSFSIDGGMAAGEATIGSKRVSDNVKGIIAVSGSLSALFLDETLGGKFDSETPITIVSLVRDGTDDASPFVAFTMGKVKITSDEADDGIKQVVKTHAFTAEINGSGGAALAWDKTILSVQDSAA